MKEIFNIKEHTIILECNGVRGTAIFMSSKSPEYDFIVTANHCLSNYNENSDIIFSKKDILVKNVFKCDELDLAIIQIEKSNEVSLFSYTDIDELEDYKGEIILYGYPNVLRDEEINYCRLNCKYSANSKNLVQLEILREISTFNFPAIEFLEGMSGSPVYIEKNDIEVFVGMYYENSHKDFAYRHINIIPLNTIQDIINDNNLSALNLSFSSNLSQEEHLDPLYGKYYNLVKNDFRNLKDKIMDVCPNYNDKKIKLLARKVANTMCETGQLTEKRRAALLYRVFLAANERQCDLVIDEKETLTKEEINFWLNQYVDYAKKIIDEKSEEYKYILKSRDTIEGVVLQLINDCYISFDEKGYYDEEGEYY
ncbi:serine protease [Clostridium baratii]|uniref:S1 family peptidase n=1 Tax=Clostridium baratii TaxID=1561 RepID=UPI002903EA27|nr:serine protease [Clostridium baratii]MDU1055406.1 serine protease [Clostridium baratii]